MSGSMSGDRKRGQASPGWGGGTKAPPTTCREATATAPVVDSTHLDPAVVEEHQQAGPVQQRIADRLPQVQGSRYSPNMVLEPDMQGLHDRPTSLLPCLPSIVGRMA